MDDFQTDWNVFHSFMRYLSVGQVECARLLYRQQRERAKFDKSLLILICGYRPQEWIYTKAVPSAAHLQWLCARMLFENSMPQAIIPSFCFSAVSLLQEAGFKVHELDSFASPRERATTLARFLLADDARLCKILICNTNAKLVRLVWRDLQKYCDDESRCADLLSLMVDELIELDRVLDAVGLFATSRQVGTCPDMLANAVNTLNERDVAETMLECGCYSQAKHASLFRSRYPSGNPLHAYLLESMRFQPARGSLTWFNRLVEAPFGFKDTELQILKVLKALTTAEEDHFLAAAAPLSTSLHFETTAQYFVNRLAFASVCNRVHGLFQIETLTSKDLITPLLLLKTTFNHTSHETFDLVSPLLDQDWLTPSERIQVLSVCLACWIANPKLHIDLQACSIKEQTWMLHLLARFDLKLVENLLEKLSTTALQQEYALRLRVGAIGSQYLQALVEWTPHQLVAHCFAHGEWDFALQVLDSKFAASVSRDLIRDAMVSRALEMQQGDFAFAPVEQQDFEFQRHNLHEFQEWKPPAAAQREFIVRLVESNFESPMRFMQECNTHELDAHQVLVDYYEQLKNTSAEFSSLVRAVEAELPFPTEQATKAFHKLVGLDWNPALTALLSTVDNNISNDNGSEYSLQDDHDDEEHIQNAARCLGYSFERETFTLLRDVDIIDEEGAVEALKQCSDISAAQAFCDKLALHLQRNTTPASERWMLESALEFIAATRN